MGHQQFGARIAQLDGGAGTRHRRLGLLDRRHLAGLHTPRGRRLGLRGQRVGGLRKPKALLGNGQIEKGARDIGAQFGGEHSGILARGVARQFRRTRTGGALAAKLKWNVQLRRHGGAVATHVLGEERSLGIAQPARLVDGAFAGAHRVARRGQHGMGRQRTVDGLLQRHALMRGSGHRRRRRLRSRRGHIGGGGGCQPGSGQQHA